MSVIKLTTWGAVIASSLTAHASYLQFPIYDSMDNPNDYNDGVNTYLKIKSGIELKSEQWLLCTSCTFSYKFGTAKTTSSTYSYSFKKGAPVVPVVFEAVDMQVEAKDGKTYSWNMEVAIISSEY